MNELERTQRNAARHVRRKHSWFGFRYALRLAGAVSGVCLPAVAAARERPPIVHIPEGSLQGSRAGGLDRYLGVPYAAPPIGALRWQPPAPIKPWSGLRSAQTLPSRCAQINATDGSEDCLYLNVFRPTRARRAGRLPVLVHVHGGGLKVGSSFDNDPSRIAEATDTVVVMFNYRLGQFGFLAHPALSRESTTSGEYGLMDQQAALRWVRERIDAFGGDPENVTIAGLSAGAWSVCAHLTSPFTSNLFSAAVMQSGDCLSRPLQEAEARGVEFANAVGCPETSSANCLRAKTTAEILASDSWGFPHLLVSGGQLLPEPPAAAVAAGRFQRVPLMFGITRNEVRQALTGSYPMNEETYVGLVNQVFQQHAPRVLEEYPASRFATPFDAFAEVLNDSGAPGAGVCTSLRQAKAFSAQVPTYFYQFDDPDAPVPSWVTLPPGMTLGASHGSDEVYWFDRPQDTVAPLKPAQRVLAQQMIDYLGAFAERQTPRVRSQPHWPRFERRSEAVLRFRPGAVQVRYDLAVAHRCEFWSSLGF